MESNPVPERRHPRRVSVLGSTGVIGRAACDIIERLPGELEVFALAAGSRAHELAEQVLRFRPRVVALADATKQEELRERLGVSWSGTILLGPEAVEQVAGLAEADVVLNGVVGAAGLRPTWRALRAGKPVALANKESLVIAGEFLTAEAARWGGGILPVDSEHNALFQCLLGQPRGSLARVVLTASGGPFRERPLDTFGAITASEALRHPTWTMGPRITVDSSTLLNKGFEVIEARWLFDLEPERIDVWVHPQSIVHGLAEWVDGTITAILSRPDMRLPIQSALCHPRRLPAGLPRCELASLARLEFHPADPQRFPCLSLARRALAEGGTAPAVLNGADEELVGAFLAERIGFLEIAEGLERVLDRRPAGSAGSLEAVLEADRWAREEARRVFGSLR